MVLDQLLVQLREGQAEATVTLAAFGPQVNDVIDGSERVLDELDC